MFFIFAVLLLLLSLWAVFYFQLSRSSGTIVLLVMSMVCTFISPWSLLLGIPLILISLVLLVAPLRLSLISKPAYKTLSRVLCPASAQQNAKHWTLVPAGGKKNCLWVLQTGKTLTTILIQNYHLKNRLFWTMRLKPYAVCWMNGKSMSTKLYLTLSGHILRSTVSRV